MAKTITIVDKIKPKSPKFVWKPPPVLITRYDKEKYLDQEIKRYREGYGGLTNFQYFYLNNWKVKDTDTGKDIHPRWREDDENLIFQPINEAFKNREDFLIAKKRRATWSSTLAALTYWFSLTNLGTESAYTSADADRISEFWNTKLIYGSERVFLPEGINIQTKWANSKTSNYMKIFDPQDTNESSIVAYETSSSAKNAKSFEGGTYNGIVALDEIAIHERITEVWGSANASRMSGFSRAGLVFAGGTAGTVKMENRQTILNKIKNADSLRLRVTSILGFHSIEKITVDGKDVPTSINGYTDHSLVKDWIEKEREVLWKSGETKLYWEFFYAYPLSLEEIFQAQDESNLPEDVKNKLIGQQKVIKMNELDNANTENRLTYNAKIELSDNGNPLIIPHPSGGWTILQEPNPQHKYAMGTDPIPAESTSKDGSDYVSAIKDLDTHTYVAYYSRRLDDAATLLKETIAGQVAYNNCLNMMEMDKGAAFLSLYEEWGKLNMAADSPFSIQGVKFTRLAKNKGFKSLAFGDIGDDYVLSYYKEHYDKIWFQRQIDEAFLWGTGKNCDLRDAMRACEIYHKNQLIKEGKNKKKNVEIGYFAFINGVKQWVTFKANANLVNNERT